MCGARTRGVCAARSGTDSHLGHDQQYQEGLGGVIRLAQGSGGIRLVGTSSWAMWQKLEDLGTYKSTWSENGPRYKQLMSASSLPPDPVLPDHMLQAGPGRPTNATRDRKIHSRSSLACRSFASPSASPIKLYMLKSGPGACPPAVDPKSTLVTSRCHLVGIWRFLALASLTPTGCLRARVTRPVPRPVWPPSRESLTSRRSVSPAVGGKDRSYTWWPSLGSRPFLLGSFCRSTASPFATAVDPSPLLSQPFSMRTSRGNQCLYVSRVIPGPP